MTVIEEPERRNVFRTGVACVIITLLVFSVVFLVYENHVLDGVRSESIGAGNEQRDISEASQETLNRILPNSVAVLPFENLSPDPDDAYLAAGIHDEILTQLARVQGLNVIARTSVLNRGYTDGSMPIPDIAGELNVETVMKGSVRYAEEKVRITAQLIDGRTDTSLWTGTFNGDLMEIFQFQTEIATQIATATQAGFSPEERLRIDKPVTKSAEAYAMYLKARVMEPDISPFASPGFYQFLDQAIELDPDFALAHAVKASGFALSMAYGEQINGLTFKAMEEISLKHIDRALVLDPDLGMAYMAQAFIHWSHQRGKPAIQSFQRALQLSPNDLEIIDDYGRFLSIIGQHDAAIRIARRAVELAPNSAIYNRLVGENLWYAGKFSEAAERMRRAVILDPSYAAAHTELGMVEINLGNEPGALAELRIAERLMDLKTVYYENLALLVHAYSRIGRHDDAMRVFRALDDRIASGEYITASAQALAYLAIGQADVAFDVLSRSPNEGTVSLRHIKSNVLNDPVLDTSRFAELRGRMGIIGGTSNIYIPPF